MTQARQAAAQERGAQEEAAKAALEAVQKQAKAAESAAVLEAKAAQKEHDEVIAKLEKLAVRHLDSNKASVAATARAEVDQPQQPLPTEARSLPALEMMLLRTAEDTAVEVSEEADAALRSEVYRYVAELPSVGACNGLRALVEASPQSRVSALRLFREVGGPTKLAGLLYSSEASYVMPYVLDADGVEDLLEALSAMPDGGAAQWERLRALLVEANDLRSKVYAATAIASLARSSGAARGELCAQGFGQALLEALQWCVVQPVAPQEAQRHACTALAELLEGQEALKLQAASPAARSRAPTSWRSRVRCPPSAACCGTSSCSATTR
ncbi:hypothetical protein T492DRAFT_147055 [Pavlovales sp. CCMP2436]|nr:hypothetical protein T492DRAFT_147055 [Pavlovales sp. CCMP2436]